MPIKAKELERSRFREATKNLKEGEHWLCGGETVARVEVGTSVGGQGTRKGEEWTINTTDFRKSYVETYYL